MVRIAIVDDSRLVRTFAVNCLKKMGHEPVEVDPISLFEVMASLKADPPRVLLMDYLMPGCPGSSLVKACREEPALQGMRILVITAHHDDEVDARLERMGADGVLHKPFPPIVLEAAVQKLLAEDEAGFEA